MVKLHTYLNRFKHSLTLEAASRRSPVGCFDGLSYSFYAVMTAPSSQADLDPQWAAQSNLTRFLALTGVFHILALISVGLRLYARICLLKTPGRDDYVIVLAVVSTRPLLAITDLQCSLQ